ncbi:uncharacterized protein MONBRDRAFT_32422 [Monosiga brevicollis MX1]|uniref:Ricin B lectin domain-containing protein n=1 Tax=Monosiga brevicollis TaxID=81824 RepID=A9UZF5_MONBE|nr:uncharacterized protein MONBRDRAFT_32422 [Monosiga brevicollis MX1]EDQ89223.1 predicted protein [Monosiga brevicollis MX1]|eukprot:XP_001745799.1 hypothetical protein [Monosiga brevicollis MX1]
MMRVWPARSAVVVICLLLVANGLASIIVPGRNGAPHWLDTDGNRIEAHGAGMLQSPQNGMWYWYGESKKTDDLSTHGINAYRASSLSGPWTFIGQVIQQSDVKTSISGPFVIERPKVIFNNKTSKYVMWFHLDDSNYQFRHAAVCTATNPEGPFEFLYALQPDDIPSLDMSLWMDPLDHQAYFVRSCDNSYVGISRLTDDYLNTTGIISTHASFEGMAFFRMNNGTFYIISSHLTGWNPNPLMLFRAANKTLDYPNWQDMGNPTNDSTSFDTQPTYVVPSYDENGTQYFVYLADNWIYGGPNGLIDASYIWLPMVIGESSITIPWRDRWDPARPFDPVPCSGVSSNTSLAFSQCDESAAAFQHWSFPQGTGPVQMTHQSHLCLGQVGIVSSDNKPQLGVVNCNASDPTQQFTFDGHSLRAASGECVDVTYCGNEVCYGRYVELYDCSSPHDNQKFAFDTEHDLWTWEDAGAQWCATACRYD